MFEKLRQAHFEIDFASHAEAILAADFPAVADTLESALLTTALPMSEIVGSGGGEAQLTQRLRRGFHELEWRKRVVKIEKVVDGVFKPSATHEIDHFLIAERGNFALEIEWNNKDPFFDRDLENFRRLHAEGVISVGAIITRGTEMQAQMRSLLQQWAESKNLSSFADLKSLGFKRPTERQEEIVGGRLAAGDSFAAAWAKMFCADKFGSATTHWSKLQDRIQRGVGNPCPLVMVGLPPSIIDMNA